VDFVSGVCGLLRQRGEDAWPAQVKSWELGATFSAEAMRHFSRQSKRPGFCRDLDWYQGVPLFLNALRARGDLHAVTAPLHGSDHWMTERMRVLEHMGFPHDHVHFTSGTYKHLVRGDVLIEDHPKTCADWCKANKKGQAILIDRPWNSPKAKEYVPHPRVTRASSYDQAMRVIDKMTARTRKAA